MSSELQSFLAFLEEQKARQASHFPGLKVPKVLSFMGTTSLPGSYAACSVHRLRAIERGASARDLRVVLGGDEVIYTSPDGQMLNQGRANYLSTLNNVIILCGHYKGIDQRVRDHLVTLEISIGDYVLSGGELAAAVITDSVVRLLPGALGDETSALTDSFQDNLLAPPVYSRPAEFNGWKVPDILLSGNDAAIDKWKFEQSLERTKRLRPELLQDWGDE